MRKKKPTILSVILIGVFILALLPCSGALSAEGDEYTDTYRASLLDVDGNTHPQTPTVTYKYTELASGALNLTYYSGETGTPYWLMLPSSYDGKTVTSIGDPSGTKVIGSSTSVGRVTIPESYTSIGNKAYSSCSALLSVDFGANSHVTSIGDYAFYYTTDLASITIPDGVTTIGEYAFSNTRSLTSVIIPESVETLGLLCFHNSGITSVTFDENCQLTLFDTGLFYGAKLTSIEIPAGIKTLSSNALYRCPLTSVTFAEGSQLETIMNGVFGYSTLPSIDLPPTVTSIGYSAFGNSSLSKITILNPDTVFLDDDVFAGTPMVAEGAAAETGIYGLDNSTAETYANENGINFHTIYKITYDSNGGSAVDAAYLSNGSSVTAPTEPTKEGYHLEGWYEDAALTQQVTFPYTPSASVTLYANWEPDNFTVTFNSNGGSSVDSQEILPGEKVVEPADPTRSGFTFGGWYTDSTLSDAWNFDSDTVSANMTLYAKWLCKVTFDSNGGSSVSSKYVAEGETVAEPADPTRTGYTFDGWYSNSALTAIWNFDTNTVSSATTLYAKWTAHTYTVQYSANNGSGTMASVLHTYDVEKALTDNVFTRTGYRFAGWATSASGSVAYSDGESVKNLTATDGATVTLYAKWSANTYTVKYNSNNGSGSMSSVSHTYDVEKALSANSFTRTGYTFEGWSESTGGAATYTDKQSVKNLTTTHGATVNLYAVWTAHTYTIEYNANGGAGTMSSVSHTYDVEKALTSNGFTRTGYTFAGWAASATGSVVYSDKQGVENLSSENGATITLYAKWTAHTYTVQYYANTGAGTMVSSVHTYDAAKTLSVNSFTKTGYTFSGWATSATGPVVYTNAQSVKNLTATNGAVIPLYAVWTAHTYTVKYNTNGGAGTMASVLHTYDVEKALTDNAFTRTGYTFAGWATSATGSVAYSDEATVTNLTATDDAIVNLYAKWTAHTYTVKFYANGGSGTIADSVYTYDTEKALSANSFTRTGYTFAGWATSTTGPVVYSDKQSVINLTATDNAIIKLYAKWTAHTYTVKYNANGGVGTMPSVLHTYDAAKTLTDNAFSRTGYTYEGWATSPGGAVVYSNKQSVSNLTTADSVTFNLYAVWTANTYSVLFDADGGTVSPTSQVKRFDSAYGKASDGTTADALPTPTRTGYTFSGWYASSEYAGSRIMDSTVVATAANHTLFAKWTANDYTITFDADGGTVSPATQTKQFDSTYGKGDDGTTDEALPTPTRAGFTFSGWWTVKDGGGTQVLNTTAFVTANNQTLFAKWTVIPIEVSTTGTMPEGSYDSAYSATITAGGGSGSFTYRLTSGTLPTGVSLSQCGVLSGTPKSFGTYTLTILVSDKNNGETVTIVRTLKIVPLGTCSAPFATPDSCALDYDDTVILSTLTSEADIYYTTNGDTPTATSTRYTEPLVLQKDTTVKAIVAKAGMVDSSVSEFSYKIKTYTVTYQANEATSGTAPGDDIVYRKGSIAVVLDKPETLVKTGYTFMGWNTQPDQSGVHYAPGDQPVVSQNITLYAEWDINIYRITFKDWDGSVIKARNVAYGSAASTPPDPSRAGYTFTGWNQTFDFIKGHTTVTATYEVNHYMVVFDTNGGESVPDQTVAYHAAANKPADPKKPGFTFDGWYSNSALTTPYDFSDEVEGDLTIYASWLENSVLLDSAADRLTLEEAFLFAEGDTWECITSHFVILHAAEDGIQIAWSSSDKSVVRLDGDGETVRGVVTRPVAGDASVIITATISKGDLTLTKTFLLVVKHIGAAKQTTREATPRVITVQIGGSLDTDTVYRTVLSDGTNIDVASLTPETLQHLLAKSGDGNVVEVTIDHYDASPADEFAFEVSSETVAMLAERGLGVTLSSPEGSVTLSAEELLRAGENHSGLYFRLVPVPGEADEANDAFLRDRTVFSLLNMSSGEVFGVPRVIQTNTENCETTVRFPLSGIDEGQLSDPDFLSTLRVYVEHHDGTTELVESTIVYDGDVPTAIEFQICSFSRFQIVSIQSAITPWLIIALFCVVLFLALTFVLIKKRLKRRAYAIR